MFGRLFVACVAVSGAALAVACSSTTTDAGSSPGTSGTTTSGGVAASAEQVDACKESCNKMKFFGCNSAEEQASCYDQCGKATPDQIQLFNACAGTSICDPACRTNITPKPAPGAAAPTGGGATPSSCSTACDKLVSCSLVKVGDKSKCNEVCEKEAYQYQIDCINNTVCDKMQSACGGGGSTGGGAGGGGGSADAASIGQCQSMCDQLLFMQCLDAAGQSACRTTCSASTTPKRDSFSSCVAASAGQCPAAKECYTTLKN
jgi:hypothetical protein